MTKVNLHQFVFHTDRFSPALCKKHVIEGVATFLTLPNLRGRKSFFLGDSKDVDLLDDFSNILT